MAIEVKHITKKYANKVILNDVSLVIPKGKFISFIGPNGAGKSTLLNIVGRLLPATSGEVWVDNNDIKTLSNQQVAKLISILKQSNEINLNLSVEELVSFGRFPYSKGRLTSLDKEKIQQALEYTGLVDLRAVNVNTLSGGQKQRSFLAMILAQDTEYIILDEPLNNLDMKHSVQIMQILRELVEIKQKTIIVVIHDINFASTYSDYIFAMKEGEVVEAGETQYIMDETILSNIYQFDIPIYEIEGYRFGLYFKNINNQGENQR